MVFCAAVRYVIAMKTSAALVSLALVLSACSPAPQPPPNIIFAIADDWSWPHAGAYGDSVVSTPTFDRLADEGVLFEQAFVSAPSCTPSRGAIVTGQHFWRLGAGAELWSYWPSQFAEYPKLLAQAGYHVGSFRKGWGPGEHPDQPDNPAGPQYESVDDFFAARADAQPFALWFGTSDPHRPYEPGSGAASGMDLDAIELFPHLPDAPEVRSDVADYYWEVQRFDREVGELLSEIEAMGELDNTLVFVTSDNGMPFPRAKANIYDAGVRMPLVVSWPARVSGGRRVTDLVSLTDVAPTILEAAGLPVPAEMTGRSLVPLLISSASGRVDESRDYVLFGKERHVPAQEAPVSGGYPMRAIRTDDYVYIRNFLPDRWPAGTPDYENAYVEHAWLADTDNGPTKTYLWEHRAEPGGARLYDLAFAKRPAEELYDLREDPGQLNNLAADPAYAAVKNELSQRLTAALEATGDPRVVGGAESWETQPYLGGAPKWEER
jgi:N-sulfoglucosamine sulfohydrolase